MRMRITGWRRLWRGRGARPKRPRNERKLPRWKSQPKDRSGDTPVAILAAPFLNEEFQEVLDLSWTRRRVLGSLSRMALVLPFTDVLASAVPPWARAEGQQAPAAQHDYEPKPVAPPPGPA